MPVVKGGHDLEALRQQHAITENVSRHVADADHADRSRLNVNARFRKMTLYRYPGTPSGNSHRLVIIAVAAAAGERIAQPEAAIDGDLVGDVGKARRTLVSRHHEIRIVVVQPLYLRRRNDFAFNDIVGDRQKRGNEDFIGGNSFGQKRVAVLARRQLLGKKTSLGTGRNDHGIFHPLSLHQAQNFGAKIVPAIGPAQTTAGHRTGPQMDAFDPRAVNEYFPPRHGRRQFRNFGTFDLEGQRLPGLIGERVGTQNGFDNRAEQAQDAVVINRVHADQCSVDVMSRRGRTL